MFTKAKIALAATIVVSATFSASAATTLRGLRAASVASIGPPAVEEQTRPGLR